MTDNITSEQVQAALDGFAAFKAGDPKASLEALAQGHSLTDLVLSNIENADPDAVKAFVMSLALSALEEGEYQTVLDALMRIAKLNLAAKSLKSADDPVQ